jgi:hypothetical protein
LTAAAGCAHAFETTCHLVEENTVEPIYTFEPMTDITEQRKWHGDFAYEAAIAARRSPTAARKNAESARRESAHNLKHAVKVLLDGVLIGYARSMPSEFGRVVADVYVLPEHRGLGHYHAFLPELLEHWQSGAVALADFNYDRHRAFYESLGLVNVVYNGTRRDILTVTSHEAMQGLDQYKTGASAGETFAAVNKARF